MTALVPAIPVTECPDFTGIQLSRSKTGHIHSPFFTFPYDKIRGFRKDEPYYGGAKYQYITGAAKSAFAALLGIGEHEVMVTEMKQPDGECWWRLGTQHPCELPRRKLEQAENMRAIEKLISDAESPVIDI